MRATLSPQGGAVKPSGGGVDGGQGTPECGGYKHQMGSKVHAAVAPLGQLLAWVTPAKERAQVAEFAGRVQEVAGPSVELALVDQGDPGGAERVAAAHGIQVGKHQEAERGLVRLLRCWVKRFAWACCFWRLARDVARQLQVLAGLHFVAFTVFPQQAPIADAGPSRKCITGF
ncbi:MAG TPA: hypothetical protein VF171_05655 [Trueperaceae bacterium]